MSRLLVETKIVAVTVYQDRALVKRRGVVRVGAGNNGVDLPLEQELMVTNLPMTVNGDSVRVGGVGSVPVKLFGARCERIYTTEPVGTRAAQLTQQIEEVEAEKRSLDAQLEALALQSSFLQGLRQKTEEQVAISLARKNMNLSDTLDLLNFLGSQYGEYAIASEDYKAQKRVLDQGLQVLRANLEQVQTPQPKQSLHVIIPISAAGEGEFELELSYVVSYANWRPLYDVRVDTSSVRVNLSYLAEITQNTGEDWQGVKLQLSTAKPGLGTLPPQLEPWYVDIPSPPTLAAMPSVARDVGMNKRSQFMGLTDDFTDEVAQPAIMAETVTAAVTKTGSVVSFDLPGTVNVQSDGTPHKTTVFSDDFPCNFVHIAMPRLVSFAYLQADIQNHPQGVVLLPGKGNIFRDQVFVGTTNLDHIAPGEKFKINLGIDENIKINRELLERQVDKKLIGSDRKITYAYRVSLENLSDREIQIKVNEQIPKSRHEKIKVRLTSVNPSTQVSDMGILEWQLQLGANAKQEIYYQFSVEYPSSLTVVGLDI